MTTIRARNLLELPLLLRRCALAAAIALAAIASSNTRADALDKLTQRLDWLPSAVQAGIYLAIDKGWFKDAGVDLELTDGTGSVSTIQMVAAGNYDLGIAHLGALASARPRGVTDVVAVAAIVRRNDLGIAVAKDLNATTLKDLVAKNIKVLVTPGHMSAPFLDPLFRAGGADKSKVSFINVSTATQVSSYLSDVGGALVTSYIYYDPLLKTARPSNYIMFSDYGLDQLGHGIIATTATITTKADALRRYLAVLNRAYEYMWSDRSKMEEAVDAIIKIRKDSKLDRNLEIERVVHYKEFNRNANAEGKPLLWMPPQDWEASTKSMIEAGLIPAGSKAADFYTNDFLPQK
jgi:NitT/TauT family transport system substrate-binding protein